MAFPARAAIEFARARGGNIAISAALLFPVLMAAAALIVDEAALYYQKRQLQAAVDLAAIHAAADPANALALAHRTLLDNGVVDPATPLAALADPAGGRLRVLSGRYRADPGLAPDARFVPGASPANAVEVRLAAPGALHFARVFTDTPPGIAVSALASATPRAGFSIGSRLARLDGGIVNALLGQLLGIGLSLSLLDYQAIASLDIGLFDFLDALGGKIGLSAGTYDQVLGARVRLADIALALAAASGGSDPAAADLLVGLAGLIDDGIFVEMADLVAADGLAGLALGAPRAGAMVGIDALEMLAVAALLSDGTHQAALALDLGVPGIAGVSARMIVGEPPQAAWYAFGETGALVRTAQVRLGIDIAILGNGGIGIGVLDIRLPVYAELAFAEAGLVALSCPAGRPDLGQASLSVRPGILRLALGNIGPGGFADTANPLAVTRGPIVDILGLAQVTAHADIRSDAIDAQIVHFSHADMVAGTVRTVSTTTPVSTLAASLIGSLDLRLEVLKVNLLGGLLSGVVGTVRPLLDPAALAIEKVLVNLLGVLGLAVGEADVRMHGLDCRAAALVR